MTHSECESARKKNEYCVCLRLEGSGSALFRIRSIVCYTDGERFPRGSGNTARQADG